MMKLTKIKQAAAQSGVWQQLLTAALKVPGVTVNREAFLRNALGAVCSADELERVLSGRPADVLPTTTIDVLARQTAMRHVRRVTLLSAAVGLPGGWMALLGAVPADLAQYYCQCLMVAQKLAYLYGFPSLQGGVGDDGRLARQLTVFVGVMMGVAKANELLNSTARLLAERATRQMAEQVAVRGAVMPVLESIAASLGMKISRQRLANMASKALPVAGAVLSGGLSYVTFRDGTERLRRVLAAVAERQQKSQ